MKSERPPWFRCEPSRLLGALSGMEPDCGYLYTILLMRIYEVGGPIDDDENVLARRTGFSSRRVAAALSWLIERDKIQRLENGLLDSRTTHEELARIASTPIRPPKWEWIRLRGSILERDGYRCAYCGASDGPLECDHILPVSKGGGHDPSNLIAACFDCNRSKGAKTIEEWLQ